MRRKTNRVTFQLRLTPQTAKEIEKECVRRELQRGVIVEEAWAVYQAYRKEAAK